MAKSWARNRKKQERLREKARSAGVQPSSRPGVDLSDDPPSVSDARDDLPDTSALPGLAGECNLSLQMRDDSQTSAYLSFTPGPSSSPVGSALARGAANPPQIAQKRKSPEGPVVDPRRSVPVRKTGKGAGAVDGVPKSGLVEEEERKRKRMKFVPNAPVQTRVRAFHQNIHVL